MSLPCARACDPAGCAHAEGELWTGPRSVEVNGRAIATVNDRATCPVGTQLVAMGSATVTAGGAAVARASDRTTDGVILAGSGNVVVGGPSQGAAIGLAYGAQKVACAAAAAGRASGSVRQSYGNCAVETGRAMLNHQRHRSSLPPVTEDELLAAAIRAGFATNNPGKNNHGAMHGEQLRELLGSYGVQTELVRQSIGSVSATVLDGRAAAVVVHPYYWRRLYGTDVTEEWWHMVSVVGMELGADGTPAAYFLNDTGAGVCGLRISAAEMEQALVPTRNMVVTKARVR